MQQPAAAQIVIVGGGAVGCGVADALAAAGQTDIVVLEREASLAMVTTSQAAGLVGQVRNSIDRVKLAMWSVAKFSELERDAEAKPGWRQVGSLRVAETPARAAEFKTLHAACRAAGLETVFLTAAEAERKWPGLRLEQAASILWCPTDGYLQPHDLCMAYRTRARKKGVRFLTQSQVQDIVREKGRVAAVRTNAGAIECETVINAAGAHAWHVARMAGLEMPIVPVRHEYFITKPIPGIEPGFPCLRFPDSGLYARPNVNSLLLGGWEANAMSVQPSTYDTAASPPGIEDDWAVLSSFGERFQPYFPDVATAGIRRVFSGWPTFVPDGRFIIGPVVGLKGFVMAGGCNAHGVSGSAGIGRHVVESMTPGVAPPYVRDLSPDRFLRSPWAWDEAERRARNVYETYYAIGH